MVLLLLASQYQHHSLVGPAPTPVGFHCSSAVLIIQGAGSGLPVTRLPPSPGFCSTKTHSTTQPLPPHHPPTTPANFIGPGTAHTSQKNRAGEWQANQLNCPDLQTLSPRVHPLPPPYHLSTSTSARPNYSENSLFWCITDQVKQLGDTSANWIAVPSFCSPKTDPTTQPFLPHYSPHGQPFLTTLVAP